MPPNSNTFYQYLGLHSLLIGIFPFYIPVYLWKQGFGVGDISLFIALSSVGFCAALWAWDRLRLMLSLTALIAVSLVLEVLLLCNVHLLEMSFRLLLVLGVTYGAYNCFYWTTQRALFFDLVDLKSSGRKYGDFQIFVGASLQLGILIGGFLLERANFIYLLAVSAVIAVIGFLIITRTKPLYPETLTKHSSLKLKEIVAFSDREYSKLIFVIDGLFLFAESFFWVITLFLIAHENFAKLGVMVLSLAAIFGILFFLLKNIIDRLGKKRVYLLATCLYAFSWALRALTNNSLPLELLYVSLVLVTFCTTFFRLAMNKRFYDLAKLTCSHDYLVLKSYYTQLAIIFAFAGFGLLANRLEASESLLASAYWGLAILSLIYLLYASRRYQHASRSTATSRATETR
ncbi:MAG: MFS transporter [Gammaproteobacteria bacterium]|nr:MFS transporter [Gammaproteobacteria bacterium]